MVSGVLHLRYEGLGPCFIEVNPAGHWDDGAGIIDATGTGALYNVLCALLRLYHPGSLGGPDDRNALVLTAQTM